jgi:hypothetical protein
MSSLRILLSDPSKLQRDCQGAFERAVEFAAADYRGLCLRERRWSSGHQWGGAVDFELGAGRCSGDVNVILKAPHYERRSSAAIGGSGISRQHPSILGPSQ